MHDERVGGRDGAKVGSFLLIKALTNTPQRAHQTASKLQAKIEPEKVATWPPSKTNMLHRKIAFWVAKRSRPFTICEDKELRDALKFATSGAYTAPDHKTIREHVIAISGEAMRDLKKMNASLDVMPCISGDIWSEGDLALLAILQHHISPRFEMVEKVLAVIPFSDSSHSGAEIERRSKVACAAVGLGTYDDDTDTVKDAIHKSCSDAASNMKSGWNDFDGDECVGHSIQTSAKKFLEHLEIAGVVKKGRGIAAHFRRSQIGRNLLRKVQEELQLPQTVPPRDTETRWNGTHDLWVWLVHNREALQVYDTRRLSEANTAVGNPDGTCYGDHQLGSVDWEIIVQGIHVLNPAKQFTDFMQGSTYPTTSGVIPFMGVLVKKMDKPFKDVNKQEVPYHRGVKAARAAMLEDIRKRFFNMPECKLEDYVVAMMLDPRYKSCKFPGLMSWTLRNGNKLTKAKAVQWARQAWEADWKPAEVANETVPTPRQALGDTRAAAFMSFMSDDEDDDLTSTTRSIVNPAEVIQDEFDTYMEMRDEEPACDILVWWKMPCEGVKDCPGLDLCRVPAMRLSMGGVCVSTPFVPLVCSSERWGWAYPRGSAGIYPVVIG
mmetsp:Transcript_11762/g.24667  ORF Transcript_11762/g.24667 Transcript_11762/m.24667 type:complete len:606 (-) Transcript_11762:440-2257(-)|eukprot:CAMPEP_0118927202 /NCGR_PEP_ID=MMETSP1169-20130426/4714_1 /TAXON_ID=36882 /ORGANISM="Pyramimonas obovata, Strain CCMP722" /LENGTH=605 /DNA_ID=CAMNT_0006868915 /DNA_START=135 /DNA_END=1952 /DNA_ORIENTATION=+